jgi:hypothetical protein
MTNGLNSRESQTQTVSPPATPELAGSPPASSPVKKTPSIRVLDAYGNEQSEELDRSPKKARASIRVLDSLGQPIDDESVDEANRSSVSLPARDRDELLSRVRRGLDELVQEMHEMDRLVSLIHCLINVADDGFFTSAASLSSSELSRVKELDAASVHARDKRRRLDGELKRNNEEFKDKLSSLRASMQKSSTLVSSKRLPCPYVC